MLLGFLFTASAPAAIATAAYSAADGVKVSVGWIVLAYFLLTVGEVLVYGTGMDLTYSYAPGRLKGVVTACFLLTNAVGNLINSRLAPLYGVWIAPGDFFALDAGIALAAAVAFFFVGRRFDRIRTAGPLPRV